MTIQELAKERCQAATPIAEEMIWPNTTFLGRAKRLFGTEKRMHVDAASGVIRMGIPLENERKAMTPKAKLTPR